MASNHQHAQNQEQRYNQNPPPGFGSESWMTNPFNLAPPANGTSIIDDVGNGQKSSYQERTYTLPGTVTYQEWSG